MNSAVSIVVIGASGNLARKKIFPALFSLYCQGFLPEQFNIFGFSRSKYADDDFRKLLTGNLACRYTPGKKDCAEKMDEFLSRCYYVAGEYSETDSYLDLYQIMQEHEDSNFTNRMFYLAVPSSVFADVVKAIGDSGLVSCTDDSPWTRVVVEKPFGRDRESSDRLTAELAQVFTESQTYRIDHYLGKEVIQNLLVLRFANIVFEPVWNNRFIKRVEIDWKEDIGVEGRGGYFDQYGIIRDIMQNHLAQIVALVGMEQPAKMLSSNIMTEKVKVLRSMSVLRAEDFVLGQYRGYCDDESVPDGSLTPTFASVTLNINNERWKGVPFIMSAGKGLNSRMTEIRVKFRDVPGCSFCESGECPAANELVIRVQPDESIVLKVNTKVPGIGVRMESKNLDLRYNAVFDNVIPEAYESLLYDVIRGDKNLFIGSHELEAAWDVFTPALKSIDADKLRPVQYDFGGSGPL